MNIVNLNFDLQHGCWIYSQPFLSSHHVSYTLSRVVKVLLHAHNSCDMLKLLNIFPFNPLTVRSQTSTIWQTNECATILLSTATFHILTSIITFSPFTTFQPINWLVNSKSCWNLERHSGLGGWHWPWRRCSRQLRPFAPWSDVPWSKMPAQRWWRS